MNENCFNKIAVGALLVVGFGLVATVWSARSSGSDAPGSSQDAWAKYEIILERNIFSKQRVSRRQRQDRDRPRQVVMPNPESYFRLRGVAQENGVFVAFLEDTRTNTVLKLRQGDQVARGVIIGLNLDSIEYKLDDNTTTVSMGHDLEGGLGAVTAGELMDWSQAAPAGQEQAPTQTETPTGDEADIIKRLMEQRRQQLGQ